MSWWISRGRCGRGQRGDNLRHSFAGIRRRRSFVPPVQGGWCLGVGALQLRGSHTEHQGERVVRAQRLMQSASDMFLGWLTSEGKGHRSFYIRQLSDVKLKPQVELAVPNNAKVYARYCGRALARAHCRSGDAVLLGAIHGRQRRVRGRDRRLRRGLRRSNRT